MAERLGSKGKKLTLMSLLIPILIENMLRNFMGTVNVLILSRYSDGAVSAVSVANQYITMASGILNLVANGFAVAISQALGNRHREQADRLGTVTLATSLLLGGLVSLAFVFAYRQLLSIMTLEQALMNDAVIYMRIAGGAVCLQVLISAMSAVLRTNGYTKTPLVVAVLMNILNIIGNYIVIFRPFETPLVGVSGVAVSLALSQVAGVVYIFAVASRRGIVFRPRYLYPFPAKELKAAFSVGIPSAMSSISFSLGQLLTTAYTTSLGATAVAAKVYITTIVYYIHAVSESNCQASQLLAGHLAGAEDFEGLKKMRWQCLAVSMGTSMLFSLIVIVLRYPLLNLFTSDPATIELASTVLILNVFVEIGRAINHGHSGSLTGSGDVKIPMLTNAVGMWIFSVGLSWLLGVRLGYGLPGIWIAFAVDENVRGWMFVLRYRTGRWQQIARERIRKINDQ